MTYQHMTPVSKDEFFRKLSAEKQLDIHPRSEKTETFWEVQHTRKLWGYSSSGYTINKPENFYLAEDV